MEFSRQGYWNGLPFPSVGELPDPQIEPGSPALQVAFFYQLSHHMLLQVTKKRRKEGRKKGNLGSTPGEKA